MQTIPTHIGFIPDGNRRWAKERGLSTLNGHLNALDIGYQIAKHCMKRGVKVITVWGFSTENWKRKPREVNYLMRLFERFIRRHFDEMIELGVRVQHLGSLDPLPSPLRKAILDAVVRSKHNTKLVFNLAINYGGRDELLRAVKKLSKEKINQLNEQTFSKLLDTHGAPDPDLIVRTSGEQRLSGFLPWQAAYAELYFTPTKWPDFTPKELDKALRWYAARQRRFGK